MRSRCLLRLRKAASALVLPLRSSLRSCCSLSSRLRRCQAYAAAARAAAARAAGLPLLDMLSGETALAALLKQQRIFPRLAVPRQAVCRITTDAAVCYPTQCLLHRFGPQLGWLEPCNASVLHAASIGLEFRVQISPSVEISHRNVLRLLLRPFWYKKRTLSRPRDPQVKRE